MSQLWPTFDRPDFAAYAGPFAVFAVEDGEPAALVVDGAEASRRVRQRPTCALILLGFHLCVAVACSSCIVRDSRDLPSSPIYAGVIRHRPWSRSSLVISAPGPLHFRGHRALGPSSSPLFDNLESYLGQLSTIQHVGR